MGKGPEVGEYRTRVEVFNRGREGEREGIVWIK